MTRSNADPDVSPDLSNHVHLIPDSCPIVQNQQWITLWIVHAPALHGSGPDWVMVCFPLIKGNLRWALLLGRDLSLLSLIVCVSLQQGPHPSSVLISTSVQEVFRSFPLHSSFARAIPRCRWSSRSSSTTVILLQSKALRADPTFLTTHN